jgi:hypothetical protein
MPYDPSKIEERLLVVAETFAGLIAANAYISSAPALPVLTERKGDISAEITKALAQLGLSIVVITPDGDSLETTGDGMCLRVRLVAEVAENVLVNKAKSGANYRPALGAAVAVMTAVDRKPNGLDPAGVAHIRGLNEFELDHNQPFRLMPAQRPTYHVTAYTKVTL